MQPSFVINAGDGHRRHLGRRQQIETVIRAGQNIAKHDQPFSLFALAGPVPARAARRWGRVRIGAESTDLQRTLQVEILGAVSHLMQLSLHVIYCFCMQNSQCAAWRSVWRRIAFSTTRENAKRIRRTCCGGRGNVGRYPDISTDPNDKGRVGCGGPKAKTLGFPDISTWILAAPWNGPGYKF